MCSMRFCAAAGIVLLVLGVASLSRGDEKGPTDAQQLAAALVRQALDHEAAGDAQARNRFLKDAAAAAPDYAPARWHLGEVRVGEKWVRIADAMAARSESELDAQYSARRGDLQNAAQELSLARWCLKSDMADRAAVHYRRVLGHPRATEDQREEAIRKLDLVSIGGTFVTRKDFEQERERQQAIADSLEQWSPVLNELQAALEASFTSKHRAAAIEKLAAIDDPTVIPAVESFAGDHQQGLGEELVKLLARFPHQEATVALVRFAALTPYRAVREGAVAELKNRPLHDYIPTLLGGLVGPIQSQYRITSDGRNVRYEHVFVKEEPETKTVFYRREDIRRRSIPYGVGGTDRRRITAMFDQLARQELELRVKEQQLLADAANRTFAADNAKVLKVLEEATGQQLPQQPQAWWKWWQDYNQIHYPKPTRYQFASQVSNYIYPAMMSCFLAGTPVWTETGVRPIESIQPGDRVLSQHPDTGELAFKVVTGTTVRPPTEASKLDILGESITTTLGHPIWVTGQGWEMAKHLKPGDQLHGVHGILVVSTIDPLPHKIEAHNLVVEDFGTYFVGKCGVLVHDNTYRQPTRAVVPGLVP